MARLSKILTIVLCAVALASSAAFAGAECLTKGRYLFGVGMSSEVLSHLFTRFFSTKAGKGTGLGLPVVKKIVEEHGGTVDVESEAGRGSSFNIRLPRAS